MKQELRNNNWIRKLQRKITSAVHIEEIVSLWIRIQDVHLQQGVQDTITWRWTGDGKYSTRSAYRIQFRGSLASFSTELIWNAHVENKCKIFAWILVQDNILTAQNLQRRGWPHHQQCVLCNGPLETGLHLCLCCPFAKGVWNHILSWENFPQIQQQPQVQPTDIRSWWEEVTTKVPRSERRRLNGTIIYTF